MTRRTDGPSAAAKIRVMKRDRFACTYCGVAGTDAELEIDHIVPVAKGGSHHISNLTTACRSCNQTKGAGTLERKPDAKPPGAHPLVGMFLHTLTDAGEIEWQGEVKSFDGETAFVQLFSWIMGEPTNIAPVAKAVLYDTERCRLYDTRAQWLAAAEKDDRRFDHKYRSRPEVRH